MFLEVSPRRRCRPPLLPPPPLPRSPTSCLVACEHSTESPLSNAPPITRRSGPLLPNGAPDPTADSVAAAVPPLPASASAPLRASPDVRGKRYEAKRDSAAPTMDGGDGAEPQSTATGKAVSEKREREDTVSRDASLPPRTRFEIFCEDFHQRHKDGSVVGGAEAPDEDMARRLKILKMLGVDPDENMARRLKMAYTQRSYKQQRAVDAVYMKERRDRIRGRAAVKRGAAIFRFFSRLPPSGDHCRPRYQCVVEHCRHGGAPAQRGPCRLPKFVRVYPNGRSQSPVLLVNNRRWVKS